MKTYFIFFFGTLIISEDVAHHVHMHRYASEPSHTSHTEEQK